jgi:hypothetical protein
MLVLKLLWQYALNWINLADHALNTLLLGDPYETLSARTGRAVRAGVAWAVKFDVLLTYGQEIVTLGKDTEDHCEYALDPKIRPNCREILNLSVWPPQFRTDPVNEVMPTELMQ